MKILRTASLGSNFTGSYKKKSAFIFVVGNLINYTTLLCGSSFICCKTKFMQAHL